MKTSQHPDRDRWNANTPAAGTPVPDPTDDRWNGTGGAQMNAPAPVSAPTCTWATSMEYLCRYTSLRDRATVARIPPEDHVGFAKWLISWKGAMRPSYWRKTRAAALAGLDREGAHSAREAEALLRNETAAGTSRKPSRAPRAKGIQAADYECLLHALAQRTPRSRIALVTIFWVMATRAVGLRPVEWRGAFLSEDHLGRPVLIVANAKTTNGRSHGPQRTLGLWDLWPSERSAIGLLLQQVRRVGVAGFGSLHRTCADLLYDINRQLWPERREVIGLYSLRHQFAADAKAVMRATEVAALMGHKTTRTAYLHYAPRSQGEMRLGNDGEIALPVADPEDVARVQVHMHAQPPACPANRAPTQSPIGLAHQADRGSAARRFG